MAGGTGANALTALLVEDNPADAELIELRLQAPPGGGAPPIQLLHAESAAAACETLRDGGVDVVILDLSLPDARWLEALHRIRATAAAVPVIVLTGTANEALALDALRAGAQDYVLKPPPDGAILRRIVRYAQERQHLLGRLDAAAHASEIGGRRWRSLAEAGRVLARSEASGPALGEVAALVVPAVADCFVLFLPGDDEVQNAIEVAHVDANRARQLCDRLRELLAKRRQTIDAALDALHTTHGVDLAVSLPALRAVLDSFEIASGIAVPVRVGGRTRGLIVLAASAERQDVPAGSGFARSLADRIGLALEQWRLFRQTQSAVAARDRAFGIVTHDLRNPLSTIQICATALLDPRPSPVSGIHNMAQIIQRSAAWMQKILQDLLDRASLDAGRLALDRRPTAVSDAIGAAQVMFAPIAVDEGLDFVVETADDLPLVEADHQRLLQVLSNLLSNAMKFTPAGGHVVLSARLATADEVGSPPAGGTDGAVRFTVSDTGPGIPAEELTHVFEWYWRSPRGGPDGAGLGLAIARGLIEAHGGSLCVDSAPERGSTFWFTIPAATPL